MLEALIFVVFPFCMLFAAISDMLSMTIANRVSLVLVGAFVAVAPLTGMAWADFGWRLFAMGAMGGGDAKLMAASAVWMGMGFCLVQYILVASVIGGFLTMGLLAYRGSPLAVFTRHNMFLRHFANEKVGVPYGIALGLGGLLTYPDSPLVLWALERMAS